MNSIFRSLVFQTLLFYTESKLAAAANFVVHVGAQRGVSGRSRRNRGLPPVDRK